jgi:hypothetical protein
MIELIPGLPDEVVGLRAKGTITGKDYEELVVPEIEARLDRHKKIRLLYVLDEAFEGVDARAAWEDTKVGLKHLFQFERIGVVSDRDWVRGMVRTLGFLFPCEVRVFPNANIDDARSWIVEGSK